MIQPHMPLTEMVTTALQQSPHVRGRSLKFETSDGRVVLRGTVGSFYQKQMAQEALRGLEGLAEITNELEVAWS
jgi:osmotically-inducible protein OsmY